MFNIEKQALEKVNTGVAIIDRTNCIVFWNNEIRKLSGISKEEAIGKPFSEVCPKFGEKRYSDMLENLFTTGQSRFCSSQLHKAFIFPEGGRESDIFQNLNLDPISEEGDIGYALLQITDVTENIRKQIKLTETIVNLESGYRKIKESEAAAHKVANYDVLTGVLNRHGLRLEMQKLFDAAASSKGKFAVLFIDIDKFKNINDSYGHLIGDVLLQQAAGRMKSNTRQNQDRATDILARVGGDEFIIILSCIERTRDIAFVAEKISNSIKMPFNIDNNRISVSASIGIAVYPDDSGDIDTLIGHADKAMYRIKNAGGCGYLFYDPNKFRDEIR